MLTFLLRLFFPWYELEQLRQQREQLRQQLAETQRLVGEAEIRLSQYSSCLEAAQVALDTNISTLILACGGEVFVPAVLVDFVARHRCTKVHYETEPGGVRVRVLFREDEEATVSVADSANQDASSDNVQSDNASQDSPSSELVGDDFEEEDDS